MNVPTKDCQCEDFPCCEHADNFPASEPEYCDVCGGYGHNGLNCPSDLDEIEEIECLQADDTCRGEVEYRMPLSGTGKAFPRCDHHWDLRLTEQDRINEKYAPDSDVPPAGFDPTLAGERWDDEY